MTGWFSNAPVRKYALLITASSSYTDTSPQTVPVNSETPVSVSSPSAEIKVVIRIKDFVGTEHHSSCNGGEAKKSGHLKTSPYFTERPDANISIQLSITPKLDFSGEELLFGNDFGYPIKKFLPYGTSTGLKLFKRYVDPSVEGDLYAEEPFIYGKALSSFNAISVANPATDDSKEVGSSASKNDSEYQSSGKADGTEAKDIEKKCKIFSLVSEDLKLAKMENSKLEIPAKASQRQKFFQDRGAQKAFTFEKGVQYNLDFFSGLVSLQNSEFHIDLPGGYSVNLSKYLNDKFKRVRYVLKRDAESFKSTGVEFGEPLLVINFELVPTKEG